MKTKVAVCIPTASNRTEYYDELIKSLSIQTFKNFSIHVVLDITPIGKAKHQVVKMALDSKPDIICMIDDDDVVLPTYLEKIVERLENKDVDWCFTWGNLFGDRKGYIHGEIQTPENMLIENHQPSWFSAKAKVFRTENYDETVSYAEDMELWIRLHNKGFIGSVIEEELYLKRWHNKSLTIEHLSKDINNGIQRIGDKVERKKKAGIVTPYKTKFRFHLVSLVHLPQSKEYMSCAFTQKNRKLAKMLTDLGHEVFFYGSEGSDVEEYCNSDNLHFFQTHTLAEIAGTWGDGDNRFNIGYNWHNTDFRHDFSGARTPLTMRFYEKVIEQINKVKLDDDFFLNTMGYYYKPVQEKVNLFLSCESGIGYRGSMKPTETFSNYRAFESSFIQNFTYGSEHPFADLNGSYYDRVIPNYFEPEEFEYSDKKKDYYFFIGRMIKRKGILTAALACKAIGAKLIIAGQGASVRSNGHLIPNDSPDFDLEPSTWEYVGFVDVPQRKKWMAGAIATFTPTEYQEIFGGTHIESMLHGTPPITTNFGVFSSGTIPDSINGKLAFRCNTLNDFVNAAKEAKNVDHFAVRKYAERYLMPNVALDYQQWFEDLYHVYLSARYPDTEKGWHWLPTTNIKKEKK